jgi:repressor LexA
MNLTPRQQEILQWICEQIRQDAPPSIRDIANRFRFRSPRAASEHVQTLVEKGYLTRTAGQARSLRMTTRAEALLPEGIPLVGNAAAGFPILSEQHIRDHLRFDHLFGDQDLFAVQVQGDSMIEAGIHDGDYALIRRRAQVDSGRIGLAFVDGEATIKTIRRSGAGFDLVPANPAYPVLPIGPDHPSFDLVGPVVGVIRQMP